MTVLSLPPALIGTLRYQARIAMRRRTLWYVVVPTALLALVIGWRSPAEITDGVRHVAGATLVTGILCTLGIGVALADRKQWEQSAGMGDLIAAIPYGVHTRLSATWAASLGVALIPPFLVVMVCAVPAAVAEGGVRPLVAAPAAFVTMLVPGAAVLTTLACLLGLLLPVTVARVFTAGFWLWSTIASPPLLPFATPTGTLLSPVGGYPAAAWFGERTVWAHRDLTGVLSPDVGTGSALVNLVVLAVCTTLFLLLAGLVAVRRR